MVHESVWVLVFDHKHGSDISVHASERSALTAMRAIVVEYSEEEDDEEVLALLAAGKVREACNAYSNTRSEYFNIESHRVQSLVSAVEELADAVADED